MSELSTGVVKHCAWCGLPFYPASGAIEPKCCSRPCAGHLRGSKPIADRFWPKVETGRLEECWLWKGTKNQDGYGVIWSVDRLRGAHRIAWLLSRGPIPYGLDVLHKCDVRACCNPDHLFVGSHGDNCRDRTKKMRTTARGEEHGHAILTEIQAREILRRVRAGEKVRDLAVEFGVSMSTVKHLRSGRNWKHLHAVLKDASVDNGSS